MSSWANRRRPWRRWSRHSRRTRRPFDGYAENFDEHLVQVLNYQAPRVLVDQLAALGRRFARALDLGCGTGLCGPLVRPMAARVDGVDLSAKMLAKAQALGVYDSLSQADLAEHLGAAAHRYDLVLAADVFIYVGALEAVFDGVARVIEPGGIFCFSVELAPHEQDFVLRPSQRYAHSEPYLRRLALRHGFELRGMLHHPIREDQRQPIAGLYVCLQAVSCAPSFPRRRESRALILDPRLRGDDGGVGSPPSRG